MTARIAERKQRCAEAVEDERTRQRLIRRVATRRVDARDAPHIRRFRPQCVAHAHRRAVARRVHVRKVRAHVMIDRDVALGRNARVLGEADICPHACRHDDQLRRNARAVHEGDAGCVDARGIRVFQQLHAFARHGGFKVLRRLRVNLPLHQLIAVLQHGHRQPRFRQG